MKDRGFTDGRLGVYREAKMDKFKQIILDFEGVSSVGQVVVDEVFCVFQDEHPDITIRYVNANPDVDSMIKRGLATV